jgi:hypothetical protein
MRVKIIRRNMKSKSNVIFSGGFILLAFAPIVNATLVSKDSYI